MKYEKNLVSVIIPTYRRSDLLMVAINSVLKQTYQSLELLVVNDNEPNDEYTVALKELLALVKDSRLQLIEQEKHINGAAARNAGIRAAKGEYIAFLDDDDFWEQNKIERQVDVLSSLDETWGGVSTKIKYFCNGKFTRATLPYRSGLIYENVLLRRAGISTCTVLLRHEALDNAGYFDENLNRHQEIQLFTSFTKKYGIRLIDEYLTCVETGDAQNRPNIEKLIKLKKEFFDSVKSIIDQMPRNKQKRIYIMHDYEVGYAMFKNGEKLNGIKKGLSVFRSPYTVYYALERTVQRIVSKLFKNLLIKS